MQGEMKVRFLVNRAGESKILYMEAGKDFVDVLLGFLQLPVATILSLFVKKQAGRGITAMEVGSISNVYESLRKMSESSLVVAKDRLLSPPLPPVLSKANTKRLLPAAATSGLQETVMYRCTSGHLANVSWVSGAYCNQCRSDNMNTAIAILAEEIQPTAVTSTGTPATTSSTGGFVQHYLSFIVTDDLTILPASTIESIVLLNKLMVEKMSDLDSVEAGITLEEALELLKVSFTTRTALNQVFATKITFPAKRK